MVKAFKSTKKFRPLPRINEHELDDIQNATDTNSVVDNTAPVQSQLKSSLGIDEWIKESDTLHDMDRSSIRFRVLERARRNIENLDAYLEMIEVQRTLNTILGNFKRYYPTDASIADKQNFLNRELSFLTKMVHDQIDLDITRLARYFPEKADFLVDKTQQMHNDIRSKLIEKLQDFKNLAVENDKSTTHSRSRK